MPSKDADGIANSEDSDQTPLGAVRSGSAIFCQDVSKKKLSIDAKT